MLKEYIKWQHSMFTINSLSVDTVMQSNHFIFLYSIHLI